MPAAPDRAPGIDLRGCGQGAHGSAADRADRRTGERIATGRGTDHRTTRGTQASAGEQPVTGGLTAAAKGECQHCDRHEKTWSGHLEHP